MRKMLIYLKEHIFVLQAKCFQVAVNTDDRNLARSCPDEFEKRIASLDFLS